uniref:type II toxin-antitoxin system RelE family toxin n=1 Tax=Ningiella ruwaisensis TaxID=2364274 RepID=UPI00109FE5B9|nr:type II toxin-antitoxin system RelE/ParE family toxin [Ningiella ruwaisensis]
MTYRLKFVPSAYKEWNKLGASIKSQFKKKLRERLENTHVIADKLTGYKSVYKIKLRTAGYRMAYEVFDDEILVYVLAVGKRDKDAIYKKLAKRID